MGPPWLEKTGGDDISEATGTRFAKAEVSGGALEIPTKWSHCGFENRRPAVTSLLPGWLRLPC